MWTLLGRSYLIHSNPTILEIWPCIGSTTGCWSLVGAQWVLASLARRSWGSFILFEKKMSIIEYWDMTSMIDMKWYWNDIVIEMRLNWYECQWFFIFLLPVCFNFNLKKMAGTNQGPSHKAEESFTEDQGIPDSWSLVEKWQLKFCVFFRQTNIFFFWRIPSLKLT